MKFLLLLKGLLLLLLFPFYFNFKLIKNPHQLFVKLHLAWVESPLNIECPLFSKNRETKKWLRPTLNLMSQTPIFYLLSLTVLINAGNLFYVKELKCCLLKGSQASLTEPLCRHLLKPFYL